MRGYSGDPIGSRDKHMQLIQVAVECSIVSVPVQVATRGIPLIAGMSACKWRGSRRCSAWPGEWTTKVRTALKR